VSGAATILAIEDEPLVRSGIVAYLEDSGFRMIEAGDGPLGVELFRRDHPEVVLCDLRLPGLGGLDVVSTITAESPETPVIIVSGVNLVSDAVQALKRGAWDFITKPIQDMGVLESAVRRALERAELMRQNRAYREGLERLNRELTRVLHQFTADQEAGRKTQSQLLPEDRRRFGEYLFTRRLYPSMYLSGDFVDYFAIDADHFGFYMADVSGHGVSSAFITVLLKSYMGRYVERFRHYGERIILDPAAVLSDLNRDILAGRYGKYLTMFYGVLSPSSATLVFSNGGQFPFPFLFDGTETRQIGGPSPPVGLFEDAQYRTQTLQIGPVFALAVFSDGILETLPHPDLTAKQGYLRSLLTQIAELDAGSLARSLKLDQGGALPDDATVLLLKRLSR
jgi:phosphoserine phosphatase RsbU/P